MVASKRRGFRTITLAALMVLASVLAIKSVRGTAALSLLASIPACENVLGFNGEKGDTDGIWRRPLLCASFAKDSTVLRGAGRRFCR